MQKRFATEKTDIANTFVVKNPQGSIELLRIDPSQVFAFHFAIREITKVTRCIAGICDGNIAQGGATAPKQA
jgi:hypothetical protein